MSGVIGEAGGKHVSDNDIVCSAGAMICYNQRVGQLLTALDRGRTALHDAEIGRWDILAGDGCINSVEVIDARGVSRRGRDFGAVLDNAAACQ